MAALIPEAAVSSPPAEALRYLVQQRLPGGSRALLWEFPGGKVEQGESDEHALIRECREELAVGLEVERRLWSTLHSYPDLVVELVLYAARVTEGVPQPLCCHELRYASVEQMRGLPFCEADLPLIEALANGMLAG